MRYDSGALGHMAVSILADQYSPEGRIDEMPIGWDGIRSIRWGANAFSYNQA